MKNVCDTIFYPFRQGQLGLPASGERTAFLNGFKHPGLRDFEKAGLYIEQHFKPAACQLEESGFKVTPFGKDHSPVCDFVMVIASKNETEARSFVARGLSILKDGGIILCAADNKAGGARLQKMLQNFGLDDIQSLSKNKARVCWAVKKCIDQNALKTALEKGSERIIEGHNLLSMPGLFSWNAPDKGSEILLHNLPDDLKGRGADFGCGYGYLSQHILQQNADIKSLVCIDADARAVDLCKKNLERLDHKAALEFLWADLTVPQPGLKDLDFIVMNPPFHEGKKTDSDIGRAFIKTALSSLKPGGVLWMVANVHLPYEKVLAEQAVQSDKIYEGKGFKVFCARK